MKYLEIRVATTHLDRHNERMTLECLEDMARQINEHPVPIGWEHDPRVPPLGRLIKARVEPLDDGEYAVVGIGELFDVADALPYDPTSPRARVEQYKAPGIYVSYDRSFETDDDREDLDQLAERIGAELLYSGKKSELPIPILTFIFSGIGLGVLNAIGQDAWDLTKDTVARLLRRRAASAPEALLRVVFNMHEDDRLFNLEIILTNPSEHDLVLLDSEALEWLALLAPEYMARNPDIARVMCSVENGRVSVRWAMRKDGVPMWPNGPLAFQHDEVPRTESPGDTVDNS